LNHKPTNYFSLVRISPLVQIPNPGLKLPGICNPNTKSFFVDCKSTIIGVGDYKSRPTKTLHERNSVGANSLYLFAGKLKYI
jgi:hypothetical protein